MLLLALQFCPHDLYDAWELARLICEIEPSKRSDVEFALCYRRDTNHIAVEEMAELLESKFAKVHTIKCKRRGTGWPHGCNEMWAEAMTRISMLRKEGKTKCDGVLTFESDCSPLRPDWIEQLKGDWTVTKEMGLSACGHWHGWPATHLNGNAIFKIGLLRDYPALNGAPAKTGWDVWHAKILLPISRDINNISQIYRIQDITTDEVAEIRKNGRVPALFHGIKNQLGIKAVREMIARGDFAGRNEVDFANPQAEICVMQLGRYGDIINILPLCQKFHAEGRAVRLMVAKAYADVAEVVDYPVEVFDGHWEDYLGARIQAERRWPTLLASVNGRGLRFTRKTANYNHEAYHRAQHGEGFAEGHFDEITLKRTKRGLDYVQSLKEHVENIVLMNLRGHSSPLGIAACDALAEAVEDVGMTRMEPEKCTSVFDLLPLIDAVPLMITADTSTLHMAGASQTPYIALVQDSEEWLGSHTRGNCLARVPYSRILEWIPWIKKIVSSARPKEEKTGRKLVDLCYNPPKISADTHRRNSLALITRRMSYRLGNWRRIDIDDEMLGTLFVDSEARKLPSVWEIIDRGMDECEPDDLVLFSNADTCHFPNLSERLEGFTAPCGWGNRRDYRRLVNCLLPIDAAHGHAYVGVDVFLMTKKWWESNKSNFPEELLVGTEAWDAVMRELMRITGGEEIRDLIYHERHGSTWEKRENRYTLPSQKQNLRVAREWMVARSIDPLKFGIKLPR